MDGKNQAILDLREEKQRYQNNHTGICNVQELHADGKTAFHKRVTKKCNEWLDNISDYIDEIDEKLDALGADLDV